LGIDRPAWFGLESMTLVALAAGLGLAATVGESPASPGRRAERLARKQSAGASLCILNHAGDVADVAAFVEEARAAGVTMDIVAPVPMIGDEHAALALARFPGLALPPGLVSRVIESDDPAAEGLRSCFDLTSGYARSGCFAGVNLSGSGSSVPTERVPATARFIEAARDAWR
jgi:5,10-methylenetetrahydrofolate reductase